ncbi:hypothetical protein EDB80DRAFT_724531 [Ilyonectria destructans]|nr:hypothetical protein EDB80DRAFT_724531 [Ilyonectria destructans]
MGDTFFTSIPTITTTSDYPPPQAAVTTIFTPPEFCAPYVDASSWISSLTESRLSSCFPGFPSIEGLIHSVYYSPAICPSGYTVDCMRFDNFQGPSVLSGETAAICCPSSFSCAPNDPLNCVSSAKSPESTTVDAVYVQIRWKRSDLSLFETPPLTSGGPTSRRHSGWDPDGSLLSVYTFPQECSSSTATWLQESETTCQPLTGDYYSPAICPEGWTAAYTRPVVGGDGPPEEPDETAMYCCPSGLNSAEGYGCGEGACVLTSIISVSTGFSIELLMSRPAIQIRWASSDLSILQTHPLTPGLALASYVPSSNYSVLPTLHTQDQLGIALAFLPVSLALVGVLAAYVILQSRQQTSTSTSTARNTFFRPAILTQRVIVVLISFMVTAIVLVEISYHVLPTSSDVSEAHRLSSRSLTKVYVSEVTVKLNKRSSTSKNEVTCDVEGDYSLSYVTTRNHGSTVTELVTVAASSFESEITTVCRVEDNIVQLPTCYEPPTAPPPGDFLNDTESAVKGGYVLGTIIPPLAAAVFGIPWKILAIHASSLEPFRQLARPKGAHMSSFLRQYGGMGALLAPLPAICWVMTYTTAAVAPLAAEGWKVKLEGSCDESSSVGCTPVVVVSAVVIRALEALLGLNIVLALGILVVLSRWSTGLHADPRSMLGVASLSHSTGLSGLFASYPKAARWWQWWKKEERYFYQLTLHYGNHRDDAIGHQDFGIVVAGAPNTAAAEKSAQTMPQQPELRHPARRIPYRIVLTLGLFTLGLIGLTTIIVYYRLTKDNQAFGRFLSSQSFGPRFLFSIVGVVINFLWVTIFTRYLLFAPYLELVNGPSVSSKSIALSYSSDSYTCFFSGLTSRRFLAVGISFCTILSDFLPLTLANIPFDRTTTWNAYVASTWVSVGQLSVMITVLLIIIGIILLQPHGRFISTKEVQENTLKFILYTLNSSPDLMNRLHSLSELSMRQRNERVKMLDLRYELVEVSYGGQGGFRPRIEVSSATDSGTKQ